MQATINQKLEEFIDQLVSQKLMLKEKNGELLLKSNTGKLTPRQIALIKKDNSIVNFIKANKEGLIKIIRESSNGQQASSRKSSNIEAMYELSPVQEGMLFHGLFNNDSSAYTEQYLFDFNEGLDVEAFRQSVDYVVNNHSILRSAFVHDKFSIPIQCVYKKVEVPFQILNYSNKSEEEQKLAIEKLLEEDMQKGFDFAKAPLIRIILVRVSLKAFKMIWTHQHILLDGWSMPLVMGEWSDAYEAYGRGLTPPPLKVDNYETFIKYINSKDKHEEEKFWKDYLQDFDTPSLIPFVESKIGRNKGGMLQEIQFTLNAKETEQIRVFAQNNHITVNTLVQATWAYVLAQYTGNPDILFGVTVSGRPTDLEGADKKVGMFINTLPLRAQVDPQMALTDWLGKIQKEHTKAREYQYSAISNIQSWCNVSGDLFDSIIVFENYPIGEVTEQESLLDIGGVEVADGNNYLLSIVVAFQEELKVNFSFNKTLLNAEYVEVMMGHFKTILSQIVEYRENGVQSIGELSMLSRSEEALILGRRATKAGQWFNEGFKNLHNAQPINTRFEQIVADNKAATALIHGKTSYDFATLNQRANQFANVLTANGVKKGELVAVFLDRGIDLVSALMGILKCGAVYVPLDTQNPIERILKMIANCAPPTIISGTAQLPILAKADFGQLVLVDDLDQDAIDAFGANTATNVITAAQLWDQSTENPDNQNDLNSWAYLLFTSGTTGEPKAAITRHDGALNHILAEYEALELADGFRFLQSAGIGSDISVWQILAPLLKGGAVVMIDKDQLLDVNTVLHIIRENGVNIIEFVPSYIWSLVDFILEVNQPVQLPELRWIMMVGEAIPVELVKKWNLLFPYCRILNGYGPCEASDDVTQYEVLSDFNENQQRVPIGRPIANMNLFVLNQENQLCPIGVAGELVVSGVGVGAGYYKNPEKTAQVFIDNPFPQTLGKTMYKTGDLGRWMPDGNLEFLGRIDRQVKIRGHRVELGEIESFLRKNEKVSSIHLAVHKESLNKLELVAFVIPNEGKELAKIESQLRSLCQSGLPAYMHPAYYCFVEEMPINLSDKIDDKKLLKLFVEQGIAPNSASDNFIAPRNDVEWRLAEIWSSLLKQENIGVQDNFFEIGGNSLLAIRLMVQINKAFEIDLNVADLFELPTIHLMMQKIMFQAPQENDEVLKVITGTGSKRPMFCVPGAGGNAIVYVELGNELGSDQPFYSFVSPGLDGRVEHLPQSIEEMASIYVARLQEVDPQGPYQLGGYSMGGMVAYEMAIQLEQKGFEVEQLIMFDAAAPAYDTTTAEYSDQHYNQELVKLANEVAHFFGKEVNISVNDIESLSKEEKLDFALAKINRVIDLKASKTQLKVYMESGMNSVQLEHAYTPDKVQLSNTPILIIQPTANSQEDLETFAKLKNFDPHLGWDEYTSGKVVSVNVEGGNHENFLNQPHVKQVVQRLQENL
ncbi:MAG: amino acid adenylation domain-containing protein [Bacteroidota bacterium]